MVPYSLGFRPSKGGVPLCSAAEGPVFNRRIQSACALELRRGTPQGLQWGDIAQQTQRASMVAVKVGL